VRLPERLWRRLQLGWVRDWQLVPRADHGGGQARRVLVVAARPCPTVDYYTRDLLEAEPSDGNRLVFDDQVDAFVGPRPREVIEPGTRVILVRMPSSRWQGVLRAAEREIVDVTWLIDDDAVAARDDDWLPEPFRLKLLGDHLRFKRDFAGLIDRVWASTPQIAARFPAGRVEVRPPKLFAAPRPERRWVTIFYHGTSSHRREHAFLLPIFHEVQARCDHTLIEVSGDHALYRAFRGVPRLRVIHPLGWPDYLAHLRAGNYDIGLAPLLDTPFNRARSGLKALQLTELGVQGVLSQRAPYTDYATLPGMHLVSDDSAAWTARIIELANRLGNGR
jgi:hypothetical protein